MQLSGCITNIIARQSTEEKSKSLLIRIKSVVEALVSGQLYLGQPSQKTLLLKSHTNPVFLHSRKRPAPVTDTFTKAPFTQLPYKLCIFIFR